MKVRTMKAGFAVTGLVGILLLALVPAVFAQGCAMCRTQAEATGPEGASSLNLAILVLLIPTVTIFVGIVLWAFRFRNRSFFEEEQAITESSLAFFPSHLKSEQPLELSRPSALSSRPH